METVQPMAVLGRQLWQLSLSDSRSSSQMHNRPRRQELIATNGMELDILALPALARPTVLLRWQPQKGFFRHAK